MLTMEEELERGRKFGRELTPFHPSRGAAVIFSSGWENMHEVYALESGTRYAVPSFFTTCPVPEQAYQQMHVGKPSSDEQIADDWLHLLLAHRAESPVESVGRVKELLMKWHYMCTPYQNTKYSAHHPRLGRRLPPPRRGVRHADAVAACEIRSPRLLVAASSRDGARSTATACAGAAAPVPPRSTAFWRRFHTIAVSMW